MIETIESKKKLLTKRLSKNFYVNMLTIKMDSYLKPGESFRTYLYKESDDLFLIRYPGATVGFVKLKDNKINEIAIYRDNYCYIKVDYDVNAYLDWEIIILGGHKYE